MAFLDPGTGGHYAPPRPPARPRPGKPGKPRPSPLAGAIGGIVGPYQGPNPFDYSTDPILVRTRALAESRRAQADAAAIRARETEGLDYADIVAGLQRERVNKPRELTEDLSKQNLFYSSTFGQRQSDLARALLENEAGQERAHRGRLSGIEESLLGARSGIEEDLLAAEESAAARRAAQLKDLPVSRPQLPGVGGLAHGARPGALAGALGGVRPGVRPRPRPRPRGYRGRPDMGD